MERINTFSVEIIQNRENKELSYGGSYYGPIGKFVGSVMDSNQDTFLIFKNSDDQYFMMQAVIDMTVILSKNGPFVYETIIVNEQKEEVKKELLFSLLENGTIDISLGLKQHNNTVFVAKEEVFCMLNDLKKQYPNDSLNTCLKLLDTEKKLVKKQKA